MDTEGKIKTPSTILILAAISHVLLGIGFTSSWYDWSLHREKGDININRDNIDGALRG